jgi:hypothetical protein
MKKKILYYIFVNILLAASLFAYNKDSSGFQFLYEADLLPSNGNTFPQWERLIIGGNEFEPAYASVSDGVLTIDTFSTPGLDESAYYFLPGTNSALLNLSGEEVYSFGDPSNPWQPDVSKGYTVEMKFQVRNILDPDARFAFWLNAREGSSGWSFDCQFYENKIVTTGPTTVYNGDLTDEMHVFRIVRRPSPGPKDPQNPDNVFDLYLDGQPIALEMSGVNAAWDQFDISFGDEAGGIGTDVDVDIDYLRFDLLGAYTPAGIGEDPVCGDEGYAIADINGDCAVDFEDFAQIARNWLLNSNPTSVSPIDCNDPLNESICQ